MAGGRKQYDAIIIDEAHERSLNISGVPFTTPFCKY